MIQSGAAGHTGSVTRHYILGTAGHIDHGKTALVGALTGTDTDRLPEEKRRGMTIDLGFAYLQIGDAMFGVVDVPGHERFVRTMVAGATGIDVALIVVAADDSVMPQTIEHVEILQLLGVRQAVVAVTKIDTVDPEMVELVREDVRGLISSTDFAEAAICPVSSVDGTGIERLRAEVARQAAQAPAKPMQPPFYMAIDRAFTVHGRGTVVTGSALRGTVSSGDELEYFPAGGRCRVRDLQTHGSGESSLRGGQRVAINISGGGRSDVQRGCVVATPGFLQPCPVVGVYMQVLRSAPRALRTVETLRLCMGTSELPARVVALGGCDVAPGTTAYAQLRCGSPLACLYGQRFIMRDDSAGRTIGGGRVLQPVTRRRRTREELQETLRQLDKGSAADRVELALREAGMNAPSQDVLCAQAGVETAEMVNVLADLKRNGRWVPLGSTNVYVVPAAIEDIKRRMLRRLERFHRDNQDVPGRGVDTVTGWLDRLSGAGLGKPLLTLFLQDGSVKAFGRFVCLPEFSPKLSAAEQSALDKVVRQIHAGGFQPPTIDDLARTTALERKRLDNVLTVAVAAEQLVRIDGKIYLHTEREQELRRIIADWIHERGPVAVAELREEIGSSRKYVVPFMEYFDRVGLTKRIGDRRMLADGTCQ